MTAAPPSATQPADPERPAPSPERASRASTVGVVLLLLCLIGLALWFYQVNDRQTRRIAALEREVAGLRGDLAAAEGALDSYDGHLGDVRSGFDDLMRRMGALGELVHRDPLERADRSDLAPPAPAAPRVAPILDPPEPAPAD